jgi:transposase
MDYKEVRKANAHGRCAYWTLEHRAWLTKCISEMPYLAGKYNLQMLLCELDRAKNLVEFYDEEIKKIAENDINYCKKAKALQAFRGIQLIQAMILITEIGDINRFTHPNKIVSYCGMDLREHSSGGTHHRFSMSKLGNRQIRTALIVAAQSAKLPPKVSKGLKLRRENTPTDVVAIADRAMSRLYKKSTHLSYKGKHTNQIKGACAREMIGFIWEAMRAC